MKVDVAIIGTGPGGGMAALRLSKTGLKVAILEKEKLPRHKPCGGAMSISVKEMFDWDLLSLVESQIVCRKYLYNYTLPKIVEGSPILMVRRSRFDYHLIEQAISGGHGTVQLRDAFRVAQVEETERGVLIQGENQKWIQADFLIAADGAFSDTARWLGLNKGARWAAVIDAEVEVAPEVYDVEKQYATFNFFCLPRGYGWIFPKAGLLSCGVGTAESQAHLPKEMDAFLEKSFPPGSIRAVKRFGHRIPIYSGHHEIATRRVCLIGDAASLVDPILGEGISFALRSGELAARVIADLMQASPTSASDPCLGLSSPRDCRAYQRLIHQGMGKDLAILYQLARPIYYDAPEFFYRTFILGGQSYARLARQLAKHLRTFDAPPSATLDGQSSH